MTVKIDLWIPLCKLMHQLAVRNNLHDVNVNLNTHWINNNICLVCNIEIFEDEDVYDHALKHAKEHNLLILL